MWAEAKAVPSVNFNEIVIFSSGIGSRLNETTLLSVNSASLTDGVCR